MIGIGSKLWRFDVNRRVYVKGKPGPVWREHWEPLEVIGETRVSWVVGTSAEDTWGAHKVPKAAFRDGACPIGWALSEEHITDLAWAEEYRHKLADRVRRCHDTKVLRAVWAALGGE